MKNELRNAACTYASWGWAVHPLKPRSKVPATPNGMNDATNDLAQVLTWWMDNPSYNIGINCRASGLLVLDVDPRNGGDDAFWELEGRELGEIVSGPTATTGGGGMHYFFRHPDGDVVGKLVEGVDVKGRGYILAAPSIHPSGGRYEWDRHPNEWALYGLEGDWLARVLSPVRVNAPRSLGSYDTGDLRSIDAVDYIAKLTGRMVNRAGFIQCPFHGGGAERTPSLKVTGPLWACHACSPMPGKACMGGNIFDFAGVLWGYAVPLRGLDFAEVKARLEREL